MFPTKSTCLNRSAKSIATRNFCSAVRKNIDDAASDGDAGTADLYTEVSRGMDQWVWFVEAHLQADA